MVGEKQPHIPVMTEDVINFFGLPKAPLQSSISRNEKRVFFDLTLGTAGHAREIMIRGGFVVGIEADQKLIEIARKTLTEACGVYPACPADNFNESFVIINDNFVNIDKIAKSLSIDSVDGILLDLGISSVHMDDPNRGFSFKNPRSHLDMRISPDVQEVQASDLLNALPNDKLVKLFSEYMDYRTVKKLTSGIVSFRSAKKIETVGDFLKIIEKTITHQKSINRKNINIATIPFMALRIAVNTELENLTEVLRKAFVFLKKGALIIVISFHSKEDRIVKEFFRKNVEKGFGISDYEKPIVPSKKEINSNPRSRSAKLRILRKL